MTEGEDSRNPLVSLVVPVHNEGDEVGARLEQILTAAQRAPGVELELIAVDDGSRDRSAAALADLTATEPRARALFFTRNFGKEAAIHAGLSSARGQCAVVLDADLQHPPELIPAMIAHWRSGFAVVEGVKRERRDPRALDTLQASLFYWLLRHFSGMDLRNQCDFKLLDRTVIDYYLSLPERQRFFRGLIHWAGFPTASLPFVVGERPGGASRWSRFKLVRYAVDNLTGFSALPLHLITLLGVLTTALGVIIGLNSLFQKLMGLALDGFTTVILLLVLIGGTLMIALGIIGHYLARLYEEIKGRPAYLLKPERAAQPEMLPQTAGAQDTDGPAS